MKRRRKAELQARIMLAGLVVAALVLATIAVIQEVRGLDG